MTSNSSVPVKFAQFQPSEPQRFIQIDEDGYFKMEDLRVADIQTGAEWLRALKYDPTTSQVWTHMDDQDVLVEAFDAPLVVLNITKNSGSENSSGWIATMPYGVSENFSLDSLTLDESDRFHGRTERGIPFVFSRSAQALFFNLLDDFDDDSISSDGKTYETHPWLETTTDATREWWSSFYAKGEGPWDLGGPHPSLARLIGTLKLQRLRFLVLGCGRGHDAAWLARAGHIVTAMDYSEDALTEARREYGNVPDLTFVQGDAFNLPTKYDGAFDIIFEHTLYCAIDPEKRNSLVKSWLRALTENGHLFAIFFASEKRKGPPYGGSEFELRARLSKRWRTLYWKRIQDSPLRRLGSEIFVYAQKIPTLR